MIQRIRSRFRAPVIRTPVFPKPKTPRPKPTPSLLGGASSQNPFAKNVVVVSEPSSASKPMGAIDPDRLAAVMHDADWGGHAWQSCGVAAHRDYYTRVGNLYAERYGDTDV